MKFQISTEGFNDIINITSQVEEAVEASDVEEGTALVFVAHSTATVSTIEYEEGALQDLKNALEKIAPTDKEYEHNKAWGDGNGHAHVRAALMKPSLLIPVEDGKPVLGQWQQPILIDFDNKAREREVIVKVISR